jgi:hypothetical protein
MRNSVNSDRSGPGGLHLNDVIKTISSWQIKEFTLINVWKLNYNMWKFLMICVELKQWCAFFAGACASKKTPILQLYSTINS